MKRPKIVHVITVPQFLGFFQGQFAFMRERGFDVHVVSSPGELLQEVSEREGIYVHPLPISRTISPVLDFNGLWKLHKLFRHLKPDIVHGHTPKGGLLSVMAARWARVPIVLYTLHGLRFVTETGWRRNLVKWSYYLIFKLSHQVYSVSRSLKDNIIKVGLCPESKVKVLAQGSANGVDAIKKFNPAILPINCRTEIRKCYNIPQDALVIAYVGRIVKDKGIVELCEAWHYLRSRFQDLYLLIVGSAEPQDPVPASVLAQLQGDYRVRFAGYVRNMPPLYAAMDILILPSYREGFPNTPLEAAAMEVPVVATSVDGCVDAVDDGITGLLVPPRNSAALAASIQQLIIHPEKRKMMGKAARLRVLKKFNPEVIWEFLAQEYRSLLAQNLRICHENSFSL